MMGAELVHGFILILLPSAVFSQTCPWGWMSKPHDPTWPCYLTTNRIQRTWPVARDFCTTMGADLVQFDSIAERDWLYGVLHSYTGLFPTHVEWWLGLHDNPTGEVWTDMSPANPSLLNFSPGEQSSYDHRKACVEYHNGTMRHQDCSSKQYFICKRSRGTRLFCDAVHGWENRNNKCIKVITKLQSWDDSRSTCQAEGGDLFEDTSLSLHQAVIDIAQGRRTSLWIGLRGIVDSTHTSVTFKWSPPNGAQLKPLLANWDKNITNPSQDVLNSHGDKSCVLVSPSDKWQLANCSTQSMALCQKPEEICASGWIHNSGYCFSMITQQKTTWSVARDFCQTYGADLLRIRSQSQQTLINYNLRNYRARNIDSIWLGLSDSGPSESLTWSNGDLYSLSSKNYTNLDPTYSNRRGQSDCFTIYTDDNNGTWQVANNCSENKAVLCTLPAGVTPTVPTSPPPTLPSGQVISTPSPASANWSSECGPFWIKDPVSHYCYFLSDSSVTWYQARRSCRDKGSELASIANYHEQSFIQDRLFGYRSPGLFIGMSELNLHLGYHWNDGTPMAYLNWSPDEPNNYDHNENCGEMVASGATVGKWNDISCMHQRGYICKKKATDFPTPPPPTSPPTVLPGTGRKLGCPDDNWIPYRKSHCFLVMQHQFIWQDARQFCTSHGGDLASIDDEDQQNFVFSNIPVITGHRDEYWLGLNDKDTQMVFQWSDGTPVKYTKWSENEPNNWADRPEDCVAMYQKSGSWNDASCDNPQGGFVCKVRRQAVSIDAPMRILNDGCLNMPGSDWIKQYAYGYKCYYRGINKMSWTSAKQFCSGKGGVLTSIQDVYQQAFLSYYISDMTDDFWIGVSTGADGSLRVEGGSNLTFTYWASNHTGTEQSTCISMRNSLPGRGAWVNSACNINLYPVCENPRTGFSTTMKTTPTTTGPPTCPNGWAEHAGSCYKGFKDSQKGTWFEARETCQRMRTDLVSIHDYTESRFIFNSAVFGRIIHTMNPWARSNVQSMWIGLSDMDGEKVFTWSDGSPLDYTHWSTGEPNDASGDDDCVEAFNNNYWNDNNCYLNKPFVCKVQKGQRIRENPPTTPPPILSTCGGSTAWKSFNGSCYYISPDTGVGSRKSWYDAKDFCVQMGGDLISIHSEQENGFVISQGTRSSGSATGFWIGLTDVDLVVNQFTWSDGTVLDYSKWNGGEPNNAFGAEKCAQIGSYNGYWNDNDCNEEYHFICKRSEGAPTSGTVTNPPLIQGGCPQGFERVLYDNKCYKIIGARAHLARLSYTSAVADCRKMCQTCDLASISNHQELAGLTSILNGLMDDESGVWIGLNDNNNNRAFTWQDNTRLRITNWDRNEPQRSGGQCVEMYTDRRHAGRWHNIRCSDTRAYACEAMRNTSIPVTTPASTCPTAGYVSNSNLDCYKVISVPMPWSNARSACESDNTHLASINSIYDQAFVDTLVGNLSTPVWIGMADPQQTGTYVWADNSVVLYTSWDQGEPSFTEGHRCVATSNGLWNDTLCDVTYPAVCKHSFFPPPTPSVFPSGYCRDITWKQFTDFCYLFVLDQMKSWSDADADCTSRGMSLVSIHSRAEENFMMQQLDANPLASNNDDVWIGFHRTDRFFTWSDNTDTPYVNWQNGPVQDCVFIQYKTARWVSDYCTHTKHYVCKTGKLPPTSPTTTVSTTTSSTTSSSSSSSSSSTTSKITQAPGFQPSQSGSHTTSRTVPTRRLPNYSTAAPTQQQQQQQQQQTAVPVDLGAGQVVGILVGILCLLILLSVSVIFIKRRSGGSLFNFSRFRNNAGFDNAAYDKAHDVVAIKSTYITNGIGNSQGAQSLSGMTDPTEDYDA